MDLLSATFSQESADGRWRCEWPDGTTIVLHGPEVVPVSRSRQRASKKGPPTSGTCGPCSSASSASVALTLSLVSKLKERFATAGSMEYRQTWKEKVTPSGIVYWVHTASGHRISGSGCTGAASGWATPTCNPANGSPEAFVERKKKAVANGSQMGVTITDLQMQAIAFLTGWPTPQSHDTQEQGKGREITETGRIRCHNGKDHSMNLPGVAQLTGWPTPNAMEGGSTSRSGDRRGELLMGGLVQGLESQVTGWNTPRATDGSKGGPNQSGGALPADAATVTVSGWATPATRGHKDTGDLEKSRFRKSGQERNDTVPRQAALVTGPTTESSTAETKKPGGFRLNPAFSLWLMGYGIEWGCCGERATRSAPKSRRSSYGQSAKPPAKPNINVVTDEDF